MSNYPRIWDRNVERKIVGETKVSWLVGDECSWRDPIKVNKKKPNKDNHYPQWFFDESERDLEVWAARHFNAIQRRMGEYSRNRDAVSPETLRKIAELIGYDPSEVARG